MPGGLHHLKHHVVLDVLHKIQHSLAQSESTSKPKEEAGNEQPGKKGCSFCSGIAADIHCSQGKG